MGLKMIKYIKNNVHLQILATFIVIPLIIWAINTDPRRTLLKESLSVITLVAFSLIIGLLYLARTNQFIVNKIKFSKLINLHKFIGYAVVPLLLLHPFLLVVPRYFEAGVEPLEAFSTIITTFTSTGVVFGLIAWILMLLIGLTSLLRKKLPMTYQTWRIVHGVLAVLCIASAALHVLDLGRHSNLIMSLFIIIFSAGGLYLLLKSYILQTQRKGEKYEFSRPQQGAVTP